MSIALLLFMLIPGVTLQAQSTNAPVKRPLVTGPSGGFETRLPGTSPETKFLLRQPKPNQIILGKLTYEGIIVEAVKTRHPLQLLNPLAPPQYGSAEDNVVRAPSGRVTGLKFLCVRF